MNTTKLKVHSFDISLITKPKIGPTLSPAASMEEFSVKMQQMINAYAFFGYCFNDEDLPAFPNYESSFIKIPIAAAIYSCSFLKKPWPKAEKYISKDKDASLLYAAKVLKNRFIAGEVVIGDHPDYCLAYSILVLKRARLPDFMHNKILANAIKDPENKSIKRYLKFKKVRKISP